ncbi:MAG: anthranilate phosphoribosyltransferase, partial [Acidobacteria bacterium]|nr:anthranilate phosphoribosyltransferase [Acidobacteriota bacterium]
GDPATNAQILRRVLEGESGPFRNVVLANASAAMAAAGKAADFRQGVKRAAESLDSGAAFEKLRALVSFTQQFAHY